MKHTLILGTIGLLATAGLAHAQNAETTAMPVLYNETPAEKVEAVQIQQQERMNEMEENMEKRKAEMEAAQAEIAERKEAIKEQMDERKAEVEQTIEERKAQMEERRQARIAAFTERLQKRLHAAVNRLERLAERIAARIGKVSERIDTSEAEAILAEITDGDALNSIREDIDALASEVEAALESEDPQAGIGAARESTKTIIEAIKGVHQRLVEAIASLKARISESAGDEGGESGEETES